MKGPAKLKIFQIPKDFHLGGLRCTPNSRYNECPLEAPFNSLFRKNSLYRISLRVKNELLEALFYSLYRKNSL